MTLYFKIYYVNKDGSERGSYTVNGKNRANALTNFLTQRHKNIPYLYSLPIQKPRNLGYKKGNPKDSRYYRVDKRKYLVMGV